MFSKRIFKFLLNCTLIFNVIDIIVTIRYIRFGAFEENNPLMKYMLDIGIIPFILLKTMLVAMCCFFLYRYKEKIISQIGIYICFCFYWALIVSFYYFIALK